MTYCDFIEKISSPDYTQLSDKTEFYSTVISNIENNFDAGQIKKALQEIYAKDNRQGIVSDDKIDTIIDECKNFGRYLEKEGQSGIKKAVEQIQELAIEISNSADLGADYQGKELSNKQEGVNLLLSQLKTEIGEAKTKSKLLDDDVREIQDKYEGIEKELIDLQTSLKNQLSEDVNRMNDKMNDNLNLVTTNSVTILGIFVAIAFAGFGGIKIINDVTSIISVRGVGVCKILFLCAVLGFILFNILFLLLYIISRLTNKSIAMTCVYVKNDDHCFNCNHIKVKSTKEKEESKRHKAHKLLCKLNHKFAYLFWTNIALIFLIVLLIALRIGKAW